MINPNSPELDIFNTDINSNYLNEIVWLPIEISINNLLNTTLDTFEDQFAQHTNVSPLATSTPTENEKPLKIREMTADQRKKYNIEHARQARLRKVASTKKLEEEKAALQQRIFNLKTDLGKLQVEMIVNSKALLTLQQLVPQPK